MGPNKLWTRLAGALGDDYLFGLISDSYGGIFTIGTTTPIIDGRARPESTDIFIDHYDSSGIRIWTRLIGSSSVDEIKGITADNKGGIFVAGVTYESIDNQTYSGQGDGFVSHYDSTGNESWTRLIGSWYPDEIIGIIADGDGGSFVAGFTHEYYDGFAAHYDISGNKSWTRVIGSPSYERVSSVTADGNGGIFVAGITYGSIDDQASGLVFEAFITHYDKSGNKSWTRFLGIPNIIKLHIADDGKGGIFAAGTNSLYNTDGSSMYEEDAFVAHYDKTGTNSWTRLIDSHPHDHISDLTADSDGGVYIAGTTIDHYNSTGDKSWSMLSGSLDPEDVRVVADGKGGIIVAGSTFRRITGEPYSSLDIFVANYNSLGDKNWAEFIGSPFDERIKYLTIDANKDIFVGGDFVGRSIAGEAGIDGQISNGRNDVFVVKLSMPPINPNPDYSNDPLNPTPITWSGVVTPYQGLITNSVGDNDSADYLAFTVLPGQKLTGITLRAYNSTDGKAFIGLQQGAQVTASASNPQPLLGYTHFGHGQSDAVVGTNLINKLGGVLTEGTYSIWIQQLGSKTDYSFNLELQDNPTFNEPKSIVLPVLPTGSKVTIADTSSPEVIATSQSSPDLIEIQAPVTATLNALTAERYGVGLVARNVGTTTNEGTGQNIPLIGIGKYTFVATAILEATTTINLEPSTDTAFFLHDAYSDFYAGLALSPDSTDRLSHQRFLNVDTIFMGSGGGTSLVDLTSKDYVTGPVTVYGADKGRSIFWGTDANDTFISRGGDSVIFGGAGSNAAILGPGRDTLQYRAGVGAVDRVEGFDRTNDAVELWVGKDMMTIEPQFTSVNGSTTMKWGANTVEFADVPDLSLSNLQIFNRVA